MSHFKTWIAPTLTTVILAIFVISSALFYNQVQDELRNKESALVAKAIAVNLANEIKSVARVLNGLSQMETVDADNKIELYDKIATGLIERYPGFFYAINFINAKGMIQKIYPVKKNEKALGQSLMERSDVKPYLIDSIQNHEARMSHRVQTFQGIHAVIIYEPLYDKKGQFKGWVNAVINIDNWIVAQLKAEGWKDVYILLQWEGHPESELVIGNNRPEKMYSYDVRIMNQKFKMNVGRISNSLSSLHKKLLNVLEFSGIFLLVLVTFLLFRLTISQNNLISANQKLSLKNILLNSLAHDIASPLASLGLIVEAAVTNKDSKIPATLKERALKNISILNEMLSSVRSLSRLEMEHQKFKTKPVEIKSAIENAVEAVSVAAARKNVQFDIFVKAENSYVEADEATLINNVLPNVFNNAIKFTETGTTVTVTAVEDGPCICVEILDQGTGFTAIEIEKFNSGYNLASSVGTQGEVGSGLGLTQVKGFMELYSGTATLGGSDKGALIRLKFKKSKSIPTA